MINTFRKQQGQGLIESLMIAVFIGLSVVAFINFQSYLSYQTELSQQKANANLLAEARMEALRYYSVQNTTAGYTAYQDIASSSQNDTVGNTTYTSTWTVTTNTSPAYKNISLTVTWTDRRGNAQSVRLVTNVVSVDPSQPASFM
jgi:Tfp pilus assembly protein PilE